MCFRYDRQVKRIKKKRVFESSGALGDSGRKVSTESGKESKKKKKAQTMRSRSAELGEREKNKKKKRNGDAKGHCSQVLRKKRKREEKKKKKNIAGTRLKKHKEKETH